MSEKQASAYDLIESERIRQIRKWGGEAHDDAHEHGHWLQFMARQQGHLAEAMTAFDFDTPVDSEALYAAYDRCIHEAVQNAAVLVAYIQSCQRDVDKLRHGG